MASITEQVAATPIHTSDEFRLIADSAPVPMWLTGLDRRRRFVNRAYADFLDVGYAEALDFDWRTILHPADRERILRESIAGEATLKPFTLGARYRRHDGGWRRLHSVSQPMFDAGGRHVGFIGVAFDLTDVNDAERALRLREQRLSAYVNQTAAGFGEVDLDGVFTEVNDRFCEITGYSREELLTRTMQSITHPDDLPRNVPLFAAAVAHGTPYQHEKRYLRPDGSPVWVNNSVSVIRDAEGAATGVLAVSIDVTEHRAARAALEQLNRTLETKVAERTAERDGMWRLSRDLLLVLDPRSRIVAANPTAEELTGYRADDLVGKRLRGFIHPADWPNVVEAIRAGRRAPVRDAVARLVRKDGEIRHFIWNAAPEGGRAYVSGRDVSAARARADELFEAQEALRQSQKLEAIGQLTGGVAHDFNNLLSPIIGSLDLLRRREVGGEREQRLIDAALQSADRARILVQRLLAFARRQPLQLRPVELGTLLGGLHELLHSTLGPGIALSIETDPDLPRVIADPNQLEMAILNLAVNARDAMPGGGRLSLRLTPDEAQAGADDGSVAGFVVLAVGDSGCGMDAETLARATEPFFSSKGIGKGTGLGLSMVEGLTAQLGGSLTIDSAPGQGTTVWMRLPAAAENPASRPAAPVAGAIAGPGGGRVLLVEDEALVRMATAELLRDSGFEVTEAASAAEALTALAGGTGFDCVVTDHLMPGMTGLELARGLRQSHPGLPVLMLSGYAELDAFGAELPYLAKPFQTSELIERIVALSAG